MLGLAAAGAARLPRAGVRERGSAEVEAEMRIPDGARVPGTVRDSAVSSIDEHNTAARAASKRANLTAYECALV